MIDIKLSLNNKKWTYYLMTFVYLAWILFIGIYKSYENLVIFPYIIVPLVTIIHLSYTTFKNKIYHISNFLMIYFTIIVMRDFTNNFSNGSGVLINSGQFLVACLTFLFILMIFSFVKNKGLKKLKIEDSLIFLLLIMHLLTLLTMFHS